MSKLAVTITMIVLTLAIIGWDIYLYLDRRDGNTISQRLAAWDRTWRALSFILVFAFGLLTGHWWW